MHILTEERTGSVFTRVLLDLVLCFERCFWTPQKHSRGESDRSDRCDPEVSLFSVRNLSASGKNVQFPALVYFYCKGEKSEHVRKN